MAYSEADLAALQAAIAKGVREVRMDGEMVEYRSLEEMLRLEAKLKRELTGARRGRKAVLSSTKSGWR